MAETTEKLQKNELTGRARSQANLKPWKKGQSRNPKKKNLIGAPKTLTRLKVAAEARSKNGKSNEQEIIDTFIGLCKKGDMRAIKEYFDRMAGPVTQNINMKTNVLRPLILPDNGMNAKPPREW